MTDPFAQFVDPMRRRFTPPKGIDEASFLTGVAEALSTATSHQLAQAVEFFKNSRESYTFPSAAECRRVALGFELSPSASVYKSGRKWKTAEEERSGAVITHQSRITAFRLCRCAMGREAHKGGWLNSLIDFAEDHQRLPEGREIDRVKAIASRNEDALAMARGSVFFETLQTLRTAMHDRAYRDVWGFIDQQAQAAE